MSNTEKDKGGAFVPKGNQNPDTKPQTSNADKNNKPLFKRRELTLDELDRLPRNGFVD